MKEPQALELGAEVYFTRVRRGTGFMVDCNQLCELFVKAKNEASCLRAKVVTQQKPLVCCVFP